MGVSHVVSFRPHRPRTDRAPRVTARLPLIYREGADASLDRPAHVRAASGVARIGDRLAVVQDDTLVVALVDPRSGEVEAIHLPDDDGVRVFEPARRNKAAKHDHEAAFTFTDAAGLHLVALGSGSTTRRQRAAHLVWVPGARSPRVSVVDLSRFYDMLRATTGFSGSELNLEGAVAGDDGHLLLLQRGNGAPVGALAPVDASAWVRLDEFAALLAAPATAKVPALHDITQHGIGTVAGGRLSFTDAAARGDRRWYLAVAELSPNTYDDGEVVGCALGRFTPEGGEWWQICAEDGSALLDKPEGLLVDDDGFWLVVDNDRPEQPAELLRVSF